MLHLIHPALVHFSVAFVVVGGVSEVWGILAGRKALSKWGGHLVLVGLISLVPTIVSRFVAANAVELPPGSQGLLDAHERSGLIVLGLLLGTQFWKAWSGGRLEQQASRFYALLMIAVVAMTVWGGWLGGQMVYVRGIGIR